MEDHESGCLVGEGRNGSEIKLCKPTGLSDIGLDSHVVVEKEQETGLNEFTFLPIADE